MTSYKLARKRATALLLVTVIFAGYLLWSIFSLGFFKYSYYTRKTYDQITTSTALVANRGAIYDSSMNLLASSSTTWRLFVSSRDIKSREKADGIDYARIIADGLCDIINTTPSVIYEKIKGSSVLDITLKKSINKDQYEKAVRFIRDKRLEKLVFLEASSVRSYPNDTLMAHLIGFVGSDSQGLYGLEYYYEDYLKGEDGYYLYAKDAVGNALDTEYSTYVPAKDGASLVTTLDSYVQEVLEATIEEVRVNHMVENRVAGIVMDVNTGAILAMATTSPFNPNAPFELDELSQRKLLESGYAVGSNEYNAYKKSLMEIMWSNKAISETYEPGSTFKLITVSAALDSGVASLNDTFSCSGYKQIGGYRIRCHKAGGHGSGFNLAYGLQMSCNPCMMSLAERVGANRFYSYVDRFGYFEKTGIDLPSEASTIFHKEENIGTTELATASFGQRFKVTMINHLRAICTVANGGTLVTPYIVEKIISPSGEIIKQHEHKEGERVISPEVSSTVSKILIDGVNGDGGAKNAGVFGYDIAAKTGTSQKFDILDENGNSYLRISSTVAYATDADSGIAMIIIADEPTSSVKYGSVVAAPYVSKVLEKVLPYLSYKSKAPEINVKVENYIGLNIETATKLIRESGLAFEVVGNGDKVISQSPLGVETVTLPLSKIILYTEITDGDFVSVPRLVGLTLEEAIRLAANAGLNICIQGNGPALITGHGIICEQSLPADERVKRGSVIRIRPIELGFED
jgi:stage V sporulation protein D (sporulation-specific penicillin-binding protein)